MSRRITKSYVAELQAQYENCPTETNRRKWYIAKAKLNSQPTREELLEQLAALDEEEDYEDE